MSLKIKLADLSVLKSRLLVLDTTARREKYLAGDFSNSDKCKDLDKRYRWADSNVKCNTLEFNG